jgi:hypothetical protein
MGIKFWESLRRIFNGIGRAMFEKFGMMDSRDTLLQGLLILLCGDTTCLAVMELLAAGAREPETATSSRVKHGPYSRSKVNSVGCRNVIFEKHHGVENHSLSLAHRMAASYPLVYVLQMYILNMVPHVGNSFERTSPLII